MESNNVVPYSELEAKRARRLEARKPKPPRACTCGCTQWYSMDDLPLIGPIDFLPDPSTT